MSTSAVEAIIAGVTALVLMGTILITVGRVLQRIDDLEMAVKQYRDEEEAMHQLLDRKFEGVSKDVAVVKQRAYITGVRLSNIERNLGIQGLPSEPVDS